MKSVLRVMSFVLLVVPLLAQSPSKSTFALWRADELTKRNQAL
jgi:hypothetical protein